jgi:AP2-associated kinase
MADTLTRCLEYVHANDFIHCDFKVENILRFDNGQLKLCDFGSVNTFDVDFKQVDPSAMYKYEEIFEKQTTLMYRPPEMCDPFLGYKVNSKVDLWMLGCVIFTLMFFKHPFAESSKLSITNAVYRYPVDNEYSLDLEILVRNLLTPNPDMRPDTSKVLEWLDQLDWKNRDSNMKDVPQILQLNPMALKISQEHNNKHHIMETGKYRKHSPDIQARNRKINKNDLKNNKMARSGNNSNNFNDFDFGTKPKKKKKDSKFFYL